MAKNRLNPPFVSKKLRKLAAKKCKICGEDDYSTLAVHRIKHGEHGGKYTFNNTVILCANCHSKHHAGTIEILGWVNSTAGRLLHYIDEKGNEQLK